MPKTEMVRCVKCKIRIPRNQAFGVSGYMNLNTLSIDYKTFCCADEDACAKRKEAPGVR
jgi:hypothetical protein